jgi:hypothetical protein
MELGDPGGVEPLARGLKARCPTVSGLNAPGPSAMGCGGKPPRFGLGGHGGLLARVDGSPARYRTAVFRLSAGRSAFELRERCWCFVADSNRGSPACRPGALAAKLTKRVWCGARSRTRTWECRCVRPMPWPLGEASNCWCTRKDLNLHAVAATASEAAASTVSPRVHCQELVGGAATADRTPVSALPKRCPATGRLRPSAHGMVLAGGLEPPASRLRGECSAR